MYSVWIGSKVKDIHPEQFAYSKLVIRRTYAIYHLLLSPAGNTLHMDLGMVKCGQIGAACAVVVEAHSIGLGPFCKGLPGEDCLQYRGEFDGPFQVDVGSSPRTLLRSDRRDVPICVLK